MADGPLTRATGAALGAAFAAVAKARRARPVHPRGEGYAATLALRDGPGLALMPALGPPRELPAIVRLSRAAGLPDGWPDLLGVAVKLPAFHGPGRDQDLLLASCRGGRLGPLLIVPARDFAWPTYSSLMPYRCAGRLVIPGALAVGARRFTLAVAPLGHRMRPLGELRLGARLPAADVEALRFNPLHAGPGIEPAAGPLNGIRDAAYRASQRAHPVPPPPVPPGRPTPACG